MPRQARLDFPGKLHHAICRGIEKREIVSDTQDREGGYRMSPLSPLYFPPQQSSLIVNSY
ncbi:MAG: hypothetical protein AB1478_05885 [Nitrospirota bacterium]